MAWIEVWWSGATHFTPSLAWLRTRPPGVAALPSCQLRAPHFALSRARYTFVRLLLATLCLRTGYAQQRKAATDAGGS